MSQPRVLPYGDRALLLELDSLEQVFGHFAALEANRIAGVTELVPAARTILVGVDPRRLALGDAERWLRSVPPVEAKPEEGPLVELSVRYIGPDLAEAAALVGLTPRELAEAHQAAEWRVAFIGFAPGFAYLSSKDFGYEVPRRATSRPSVPSGSLGLAGEFSGIYPRSSPGGWQLIGHSDALLWSERRARPALLTPGTRVRFREEEP